MGALATTQRVGLLNLSPKWQKRKHNAEHVNCAAQNTN
jgi:hypothetical protein